MSEHELILEQVYPTGVQMWHCPVCGLRFVLRWEPYRRMILDQGDPNAIHLGGVDNTYRLNIRADDAGPFQAMIDSLDL